MDARSELARERLVLAKADADIQQGEARVGQQEALVADLCAKSHDTHVAERLLRILRETLHEWRQHRALILGRIAYLDAKLAASESPSREGGNASPG